MIIKGFTISRGSAHAAHLLKADDNEHVLVQEIRGFVASDLAGAFKESQAIARGTKCRQHLFSCAFSPPESSHLSADQFLHAVDRTEQALGLGGQPRAIVFHEKDGRRHAHCVWSRIDAETMTARQLSHWKNTRRIAVFDHHHPTDERARVFAEGIFPIRRPKIMRRADRFLGSVVEIVSEGRADLALQLDRRDQPKDASRSARTRRSRLHRCGSHLRLRCRAPFRRRRQTCQRRARHKR